MFGAGKAKKSQRATGITHQISPQRSLIGRLSTDSNGDVSHFGFPVGTQTRKPVLHIPRRVGKQRVAYRRAKKNAP